MKQRIECSLCNAIHDSCAICEGPLRTVTEHPETNLPPFKVRVECWASVADMVAATLRLDIDGTASIDDCAGFVRMYDMNHNNPAERRVLGEQCRNAFEAGQCIVTYPKGS